jgi:hypothetical protein
LVIPKILHRIWFGSNLPKPYRDNLLELVKHNGVNHQIRLWIDTQNLSTDEYRDLQDFCDHNHIMLFDIRSQTDLLNYDLITQELDIAQKRATEIGFQPKLHLVRASDLARVALLIKFGGIYTDTDTNTLMPLPDLHASYGVFCKFTHEELTKEEQVELKKQYPDFTGLILFDFIAAMPQNEIMLTAAAIARLDFNAYHKVKQDSWEYIAHTQFHLEMTTLLSGNALRCALNYITVKNKLSYNKSKQLFFDVSPYFDSTYDKSWLDDHVDRMIDIRDTEQRLAYAKKNVLLSKLDERILDNLRSAIATARLPFVIEPDEDDLNSNQSQDLVLLASDVTSMHAKLTLKIYTQFLLLTLLYSTLISLELSVKNILPIVLLMSAMKFISDDFLYGRTNNYQPTLFSTPSNRETYIERTHHLAMSLVR